MENIKSIRNEQKKIIEVLNKIEVIQIVLVFLFVAFSLMLEDLKVLMLISSSFFILAALSLFYEKYLLDKYNKYSKSINEKKWRSEC